MQVVALFPSFVLALFLWFGASETVLGSLYVSLFYLLKSLLYRNYPYFEEDKTPLDEQALTLKLAVLLHVLLMRFLVLNESSLSLVLENIFAALTLDLLLQNVIDNVRK